jgi:hypothetical protein
VNFCILYKENSLRLTICACYLWKMGLNIGLDVLFDNMCVWKGIREKTAEVNSTKFYITNEEILNAHHVLH